MSLKSKKEIIELKKEIKALEKEAYKKIKIYLESELLKIKKDALMFHACTRFDYEFDENSVKFSIKYEKVEEEPELNINQFVPYFAIFDNLSIIKQTVDAEKEKRMIAQIKAFNKKFKK